MKRLFFFILISFFSLDAGAQELFPNTESASTLAKGVFAARFMTEYYYEVARPRFQFSGRLMYGITPNWEVRIQASVSNHHGKSLPVDLVTHTHIGNATYVYAGGIQYGRKYPYLFGGVDFYTKYRFLHIDGEQSHFRMAAYAEYSTAHTAHDESEPVLEGDNGGYGGGIIATKLSHRLAISLTTGFIVPNNYHEPYYDTTRYLTYGKGINYNLSIGYLIYPSKYEDYAQSNYNLYLEFIGKSYGKATVNEFGEYIPIQNPALIAGHYLEAHVGIQRIINSNLRLDLSAGFPLIHRSWEHFYPVINFGVQKSFF